MLVTLWLALRRPATRRVETTLGEIDTRLAGIDERIDAALRPQGQTGDTLGPTIGETLDLEEVLQRTLAAAHAVGPVEGGHIAVRKPDDSMAMATSGLVADGAGRALNGPPDGSAYTHGAFTWEVPDPNGLRAGLTVPLAGGSLAVFSRASDAFGPDGAAILSAIARRAEPAVRNALAHLVVLERAATDLLTGLGSASAFAEALPRAISTARRTRRPLCLVQIDLDDFGTINKRFGLATGNTTLGEFGRRVLATIRGSDAAYRNSGGADEFFLILPETTRDEAKNSYHRLCFEVSGTPFEETGKLTMSSGLVELGAEETLTTMLQRADALVRSAKDHGKNRLYSDDGEEWVSPH